MKLATFSFDKLVPPKHQLIVILMLILVVFFLFYSPLYFGGKTFQSGDILTSKSMEPYVRQGGGRFWNPYEWAREK